MIRVVRAGLLTTVQDLGRHGMQQHGVITAGAMDGTAHRIANLLVGNAPDAASLECTMLGPALKIEIDALIAIGGADLDATLDGRRIPLWCPFTAPAGSLLSFGIPRAGCRAYIAFAGGLDVPVALRSRSTDLIASIGGAGGRALEAGDTLAFGDMSDVAARIARHVRASPRAARGAGRSLLTSYAYDRVVRIMGGPEHDRFSAASRERLVEGEFEVTPQSNRMGIRLAGTALTLERPFSMISAPVAAGTIQVPASGDPIVLMADHQTIGGYPRIAGAITVDLPLLAQVRPGERVRFREVTLDEAQSLYARRERDLRMFADALRIHYS